MWEGEARAHAHVNTLTHACCQTHAQEGDSRVPTHICTHIWVHMYAHTHTHSSTWTCATAPLDTTVYMCTNTGVCGNPTLRHNYAHVSAHGYTQTHKHGHTCPCTLPPPPPPACPHIYPSPCLGAAWHTGGWGGEVQPSADPSLSPARPQRPPRLSSAHPPLVFK